MNTPARSVTRSLRSLARVVVAGGLAVTFGAACSGDDDDRPELPVVDVGQDLVGTCLAFPADVTDEVESLPSIDCAEPHSHEVFAVVESRSSNYPGLEALEAEAQVACLDAFEAYVGINPFDSKLFADWLVPTLTSWDRSDDREIICVAGNLDGRPLEASIAGSAR